MFLIARVFKKKKKRCTLTSNVGYARGCVLIKDVGYVKGCMQLQAMQAYNNKIFKCWHLLK